MKSALVYIDGFDDELLQPLLIAARAERIDFETRSRRNEVMATAEWYVVPAVALYLAKPFIDKFLAKASDDFIAITYPRFKQALQRLVKRLYIQERSSFTISAAGRKKVSDEGAWLFGVYSLERSGRRIKFIFGDGLSEEQYVTAVEELLRTIRTHHLGGLNDEIAQGIGRLVDPTASEILLMFHAEKGKWFVFDPVARLKEWQRREKP